MVKMRVAAVPCLLTPPAGFTQSNRGIGTDSELLLMPVDAVIEAPELAA